MPSPEYHSHASLSVSDCERSGDRWPIPEHRPGSELSALFHLISLPVQYTAPADHHACLHVLRTGDTYRYTVTEFVEDADSVGNTKLLQHLSAQSFVAMKSNVMLATTVPPGPEAVYLQMPDAVQRVRDVLTKPE